MVVPPNPHISIITLPKRLTGWSYDSVLAEAKNILSNTPKQIQKANVSVVLCDNPETITIIKVIKLKTNRIFFIFLVFNFQEIIVVCVQQYHNYYKSQE